MDNSNLNSGRHSSRGSISGTKTIVMRDTGSTTCVVKKSLVKPEQMTGSCELCMLIDGIVERYPTAMVELDTPYFNGKTKVLCMDVQDIIVGNIHIEWHVTCVQQFKLESWLVESNRTL